jgi:hypothetical protein
MKSWSEHHERWEKERKERDLCSGMARILINHGALIFFENLGTVKRRGEGGRRIYPPLASRGS